MGLQRTKGAIVVHMTGFVSSSLFENLTNKRVVHIRPSKVNRIYARLLHLLKVLKHPAMGSDQARRS